MRPPTGAGALPNPQLHVRLASGVQLREAGRLVIGGEPLRLMRVAAAGAAVLAAWRRGAPVGDVPGAAALARRLLDAGALLSDPAPRGAEDVAVVVPTRDRAPQLARCLGALRRSGAGSVLVVDDGSADADAVRAAATSHGAAVVRRDRAGGPAAARNAGARATDAPFLAFVDSDVVVDAGWLERLRGHFDDPAAGAAAPRVLGLHDAGSRIAAYEGRRSSLDMGAGPASIGPGRAVSYVPSAALVVRRSALPESGFDENLAVGEDVDLVWRMTGAGWRVAYDPAACVRHEHRVRPLPFFVRRWDYAWSIGPLAVRHPHALRPLRLDAPTAAVAALLLLGRPSPAAVAGLVRLVRLRRKLTGRSRRPGWLAAELSARAYAGAALGLSHGIRRVWSPPLALLALAGPGRMRRRTGTVLACAFALGACTQRPASFGDACLGVVDDVVAAFGTWGGSLAAGTASPLLPRVGRPARDHG